MRWILALTCVLACSAPTHSTARYYAFHTKWPIDVDKAWEATVATVAAHYKTRVVDREHGVIMTVPETLDARDPSLSIEYVVELHNTYAHYKHASTDIPAGLRVVVAPIATRDGHVLPPEQMPAAAESARDDLLGAVKEGIWRSGAVH